MKSGFNKVKNFASDYIVPAGKTALEVYNIAKMLAPIVGLGNRKKR